MWSSSSSRSPAASDSLTTWAAPRVGETTVMVCRGVLNHAIKLEWIDKDPSQPIELDKRRYSGEYDFYSLEEVLALARAATSEQDAVLYLTAAMSGLRRGELLALTWRDVDFAGQAIRVRRNLSYGELTTPKSGRVRAVPMVAQLANPLARLSDRKHFSGDDDFVFGSPTGGPLTAVESAAAIARPPSGLGYVRCPSTACATTSDPWPLTAPRWSRSRPGWATPSCRPPRGTCITELRHTTRRC
jgi:hypothetical protein